MFTDVVYSSILKTKHSTVLVTCDQPAPHMPHNGHRVQLYDLRALNIDRWRHCIGVYPWGSLLQCYDIEHLYVNFLEIIQHIVTKCVPCKNVTLGPVYYTTKSLLRQRNHLRRRGRIEEANVIEKKINVLISQTRSASVSRLSMATTKELWAAVNKTKISLQCFDTGGWITGRASGL